MHARQLLVGGERRVVALEELSNPRGDQLILDGREALGTLGVPRTHLVLEAVGVRDECHSHASNHTLYNRAMLLKTQFKPAAARTPLEQLIAAASQVILGKEAQVRLALACLIARGHLLIEDLPGVGKTTLAHVLARTLGLHFQRIQFTSDMLPADIIGVSVYEREGGTFKFHPGPIFAQLILADEVNRATPKTQSALLEAMEEHQVTVETETRKLPEPFFVIATQNPSEQVGTFPLPESQLDRFLMRIELGYPDRDAERALLAGADRRDLLASLEPCMIPAELVELQADAQRVHVAPALLDYVQAIVEYTRRSPDYVAGLSPRAALALVHSARAWALLEGRDKVIPEDVQAILPGVATHRLRPAHDAARRVDIAAQLLTAVPIP
jgi:MoxR-like ATPase